MQERYARVVRVLLFVCLGLAMVAIVAMAIQVQLSPLAAGAATLLIAMFQAFVTWMFLETSNRQFKRTGAVVAGRQVPCNYAEWGTGAQVLGVEIWNEGRQETQIRDAWFQWGDDELGRPNARFIWAEGGPHKDVDMGLSTRLLAPGRMWQIRIVLSPPEAIASRKDPKLVVVPVLGRRLEIPLKDGTMLTGRPAF